MLFFVCVTVIPSTFTSSSNSFDQTGLSHTVPFFNDHTVSMRVLCDVSHSVPVLAQLVVVSYTVYMHMYYNTSFNERNVCFFSCGFFYSNGV